MVTSYIILNNIAVVLPRALYEGTRFVVPERDRAKGSVTLETLYYRRDGVAEGKK